MGEFIFLGVLLIISLVAFFMAGTFPTSQFDTSSGPGLFPRIVAAGLAICCIILIVEKIKKKEYNKPFAFLKLFYGTGGAMLYSTLLFVILMNFLGFAISCALYLVFIVNYFKYQVDGTLGKPVGIVVRSAALVASAVIIDVLIGMANIMLPVGMIFK